MKLPLSWLKDYTSIDGISCKEYAAALTMSGSKVEGIENLSAEIDRVVTAEILSVERRGRGLYCRFTQVFNEALPKKVANVPVSAV